MLARLAVVQLDDPVVMAKIKRKIWIFSVTDKVDELGPREPISDIYIQHLKYFNSKNFNRKFEDSANAGNVLLDAEKVLVSNDTI
jgi:hypothetical protein